jgi:DNA-binding transcriptional LysR family regulator
MREKVRELVSDAHRLLRPAELNLSTLQRGFTLRTSDGFLETFGSRLISTVRDEAPGVRLRFVRKLDKDSAGLRDGSIDFETGVVAPTIGPEIRAQALFVDRYVGVVREAHPLSQGEITPERYASFGHIVAWRQGLDLGEVDPSLASIGLKRDIIATVDGFAAALALARVSDLVATVPQAHTAGLQEGMHTFALPLSIDPFTISLLWHPRLDGDPAHRWLRAAIRHACKTGFDDQPAQRKRA